MARTKRNTFRFNGSMLKKLRSDRYWSRCQLGRMIEKSSMSVTAWEEGSNDPSFSTVVRISEVLERPLADFIKKGGKP